MLMINEGMEWLEMRNFCHWMYCTLWDGYDLLGDVLAFLGCSIFVSKFPRLTAWFVVFMMDGWLVLVSYYTHDEYPEFVLLCTHSKSCR